jgi:hypothetical protein
MCAACNDVAHREPPEGSSHRLHIDVRQIDVGRLFACPANRLIDGCYYCRITEVNVRCRYQGELSERAARNGILYDCTGGAAHLLGWTAGDFDPCGLWHTVDIHLWNDCPFTAAEDKIAVLKDSDDVAGSGGEIWGQIKDDVAFLMAIGGDREDREGGGGSSNEALLAV